MSAEAPEVWHRLHPLSPVVRGGRVTTGLAILLFLSIFGRGKLSDAIPQLAIVGILLAGGFISWLVTRWRIEEDDLRIETGLFRRRSLRFPLAQVQAIDVVRPGLGRIFHVAELRLRMAGASGATARLAYVAEHEVEPLRNQLLALARGARHDEGEPELPIDEAPAATEEHVVAVVSSGRLVASIGLEYWWLIAILVGILVAVAISPHTVGPLLVGGGLVWTISLVTFLWRRFNQQYRLTVAEGPDGLHLHGGLVALSAEIIRPGRVQAVRLVEPLLWRPFGWCRLEVDLAGRQRPREKARRSAASCGPCCPSAHELSGSSSWAGFCPTGRAICRRRPHASVGRAHSAIERSAGD